MKFLITLLMAIFSSVAFSCTDFSGEYQTSNMTYYSISQNGCESMDVTDETGFNKMLFDNIERLIYEYDVVIEGEVLAHIQIFLKSKMEGHKWVYAERDVIKYKSGEIDIVTKWAEVSFNEDTDLFTVLHNEDGSTEEFVDIRKKD